MRRGRCLDGVLGTHGRWWMREEVSSLGAGEAEPPHKSQDHWATRVHHVGGGVQERV